MKIEVDYEREVVTVNGYDISFSLLEGFTTMEAPGPWARVVRRKDGVIYAENATTDSLLEQWVKDGAGK